MTVVHHTLLGFISSSGKEDEKKRKEEKNWKTFVLIWSSVIKYWFIFTFCIIVFKCPLNLLGNPHKKDCKRKTLGNIKRTGSNTSSRCGGPLITIDLCSSVCVHVCVYELSSSSRSETPGGFTGSASPSTTSHPPPLLRSTLSSSFSSSFLPLSWDRCWLSSKRKQKKIENQAKRDAGRRRKAKLSKHPNS